MKNLKVIRMKHKITQADLAKILNAAPNTISQWENGVNEPDIATLKKLANFFNVSTDFLLDMESGDGVNYPNRFIEATDRERSVLLKYRIANDSLKTAIDTILNID